MNDNLEVSSQTPAKLLSAVTSLQYQFSSSSVYLIPFKHLHDRIQTQIRT